MLQKMKNIVPGLGQELKRSGGAKLVLWTQTAALSEMMRSYKQSIVQ